MASARFLFVVIVLIKQAKCDSRSDISNSSVIESEFPNSPVFKFGEKEICLVNTTCRLARVKGTTNYQQTLQRLFKHIYLPSTFDLSTTENVSAGCKIQTGQYLEALSRFELWALKMYDANSKIPSGLLNGNVNQLGDFDMCLSIEKKKFNIKGRYCLAALQVVVPKDQNLKHVHKLLHSHYIFKSKLQDPGHRVPRFSSINWALCVPSYCNASDVELGLRKYLDVLFNGTEIEMDVVVDPIMCQTTEAKKVSWASYIAIGLFVVIVAIALCSTVYDYVMTDKKSFLVAFSFRKNVSALMSVQRSPHDIEAAHGIRFVNAIMLVISHKSMVLFFVPYVNRTKMSEIMGRPWTVFGRAASLYTDPFIMLSGTLTTHYLLRKLKKRNKINLWHEYASRLFRIVPTLGALILFCTLVLPLLNNGPNWNLVVTHHAEICKKYWWRNLLFIHNYFGFKDMCLTHTHHIGIDTQLFLVLVAVVPFIWKRPKISVVLLVIVAVFSTALRYNATYFRRLSNYIHFGTSIEQLFDTADYMYILPIHRATVYIMGILLAYLLHQYESTKLSSVQLQVGDTVAFCSFCIAFFGPSFMGSHQYKYNPVDAAQYAAFAPILWCISFAWIIFTTHIKQSGLLGKILSSKMFLVTTKLSYSMYLTQFPVFFYNVGIVRTPEYYKFTNKMFNVGEWLWIILFSTILHLLFESPFQNIRAIVLKNGLRIKKIVD
ncbi:hypothetical protein FQA39_LY15900 [Lamprigera yunnana]|nr:hypothetical protein FQA39_LY15900 [Lamprigera yunnana]